MLRFIVKHRLYFVLSGILIALICTIRVALPAVAIIGPRPGDTQQNRQIFHGASNFGNTAIIRGRNQANSGNPGVNRGFNQDNTANAGNQLTSQHKRIGIQNNQQFLHQSENGSSGGNNATFIGAFQGNSGNSGINLGNNQDNSANSGNQVNNQGNIIGTQINKQGSSVTNDGNIIQHQINYVDLIPGLGVYVSLRPKIQFAVSIGH
jgi:hypothetical protein